MKKLFLFLSFLLFSVGIFSTNVTILPTDFTATTGDDYSTTKSNVTVEVIASTVTSD